MEQYVNLNIRGNALLLVFVEKDDNDFEILGKHLVANSATLQQRVVCKLPPGNWQILALSDQIENEQLEAILPDTFIHRRFSHFQDIVNVITDGEPTLILKKTEE